MAFRKLKIDELAELEKEYIQFLIANGIDASEWERIKVDNTERAEGLILQFSEIVFRRSLEKVTHLEHRTSNFLKFFYCAPNHIELLGIRSEKIDLSLLKDFSDQVWEDVEVVKGEKRYKGDREEELFEMTEQGCFITDDKLFLALKELIGK